MQYTKLDSDVKLVNDRLTIAMNIVCAVTGQKLKRKYALNALVQLVE